MPHSKSAAKRLKQSVKKRLRNRSTKAGLKTLTKKIRASSGGEATALLRNAYKEFDKAATKGIIHRNTAARKKSRLAKAVARAQAQTGKGAAPANA